MRLLQTDTTFSLAERATIETALNSSTIVPLTVAPTITSGSLGNGTGSANFATSSAQTWTTGGGSPNPFTIYVANPVIFLVGSPPTVAETIVGILVVSSGSVNKLYIAFDNPIIVGAGYGYAQLAIRLQEQVTVNGGILSDASTVSYLQI